MKKINSNEVLDMMDGKLEMEEDVAITVLKKHGEGFMRAHNGYIDELERLKRCLLEISKSEDPEKQLAIEDSLAQIIVQIEKQKDKSLMTDSTRIQFELAETMATIEAPELEIVHGNEMQQAAAEVEAAITENEELEANKLN